MTRLLALIVFVILIWVVLQNLKERVRITVQTNVRRPQPPPQASSQPAAVETLVRCEACGVHVPRSRTLPGTAGSTGTEAVYCSERCRTAVVAS